MQRLCIARAIAVSPEVILMDEPCWPSTRNRRPAIEDLIGELRSEYTIIIVTHNMQQAARVSDFTAFLYEGYLVEYGRDQADVHQTAEEADRRLHHRPFRLIVTH